MAADVQELAELVRLFTTGELPKARWTHHAHLAVGLWHVDRYGPDDALARLRGGITRLNERHGTINSASSGYHETVTRAYVKLLDEFNRGFDASVPLAQRCERLLGGPLADPKLLLRFYTAERLMSVRARAEWVEPDRGPCALGPT